MWVLKLIVKNAARHKLRTLLSILGISIAVIAYGLIRTATTSWNKSIDCLSPNRLVVRNAVSFIFDMPLSYKDKIKNVPGVEYLAYLNWFAGVYKDDPKNFFGSVAVGSEEFFDLYPEIIMSDEQKNEYFKLKRAAFAGQKLVDKFGWKIGDEIKLTSQIYPGEWDFKLAGIYTAAQPSIDEFTFYFHWDYFNEELSKYSEDWANNIGWVSIRISNPDDAALISASIDDLFRNSAAETLTETEKAFSQSFLSGLDTIIVVLKATSYLIIGVILLVLANTMSMNARERISEYALLKTLGFQPFHLAGIIMGESFLIAFIGGILGILLAFPITEKFGEFVAMFFTYFKIDLSTIILSMVFVIMVGFISAVFPVYKSVKTSIVDGLRNIG